MQNQNRKITLTNQHSSLLNNTIDLFITCLGYEERSCYIFNKLKPQLTSDSCLLFSTNSHSTIPSIKKAINDSKQLGIVCNKVQYNDSKKVHNLIISKVKKIIATNENARIHIDYSSMPRSWYCKIPQLLCDFIGSKSQVYFWYSEGIYENFDDVYPTAGIDTYTLFSGKPTLFDGKRTHLIGVGYDTIRTNGIITLLNPESVIICYANNPNREDVATTVKSLNSEIMAESFMNLSLDITDFEFMIAKLSGIINELHSISNSDIVLIPDGPKPLIFSMSLIPWLLDKYGISCLHINRNDNCYIPNNVKALGNNEASVVFTDDDHIIGFSMATLKNEHLTHLNEVPPLNQVK